MGWSPRGPVQGTLHHEGQQKEAVRGAEGRKSRVSLVWKNPRVPNRLPRCRYRNLIHRQKHRDWVEDGRRWKRTMSYCWASALLASLKAIGFGSDGLKRSSRV